MTEILTTAQYAERYGLNEQAVRRMCVRGELPAKKVGSVWRIADEPPGADAEREEALAEMRRDLDEIKAWMLAVRGACGGPAPGGAEAA